MEQKQQEKVQAPEDFEYDFVRDKLS